MSNLIQIAFKLIILISTIKLVTFKATGSDVLPRNEKNKRIELRPREEAQDNFIPNSIYNQWDKDGSLISNKIDEPNSKPSNEVEVQREYVCGRAQLNKRYKNSQTDANPYKQLNQAKYRPTEIRMPRIIGGDMATPGEFPWTASIKLNEQPICGGSLIDKSWVLTAAHCVVGYNPKNLTIRLGAYRIKDLSETHSIDTPVSMFIVHKDYSMPRPFSNDIALVKLQEPVQYSDYIIPICLPNEDQISTSTSNVVINDYSNKHQIDLFNKDDEDGIVISTKMSDHDIAQCFSKLEQNYLNSIGLGTISLAATASPNEVNPVASSELPPSSGNNRYSYERPPAVDSTTPRYLDSFKENSYYPQINNPHKITYITQQFREQQQQQLYNQKLKQIQEPTQIAFDFNNFNSPLSDSHYVYYGLPWTSAKRLADNVSRDNNKIKLSRLPISKELLKEIQSVGSGPIANLDLGLQQADLVNMASDLSQINRPAEDSSSRGILTNFLNKVIRSSSEEDDAEDDPTKYSGLSGIVVGWGWVRELDEDDHSNNKGYSSITLQKVKLPILRNNICEEWFQSQSKKITLLPSQFCAGFNSGGKDACRGDSGGPMIIEDNSDTGRYKLIGIVSAGIGCARRSLPGLYTRVASFLPWINAQMLRY